MRLRPKTVRRLTLLALAGVLVLALGVSALIIRDWRRQQAIDDLRAEGLELYHQAEYREALPILARYTRHRDDDAEALLALARARRAVEVGDGSHLAQAAAALREYRLLEPDDAEAARELLELYRQLGMNQEAVALAEDLLADADLDPAGRAEVLLARALALRAIDPLDPEVESIILEAADEAPTDFAVQRYRVASLAEDDLARACEAAASLAESHEDPRFEVLRLLTCDLGTADNAPSANETLGRVRTIVEGMDDAAFASEEFVGLVVGQAVRSRNRELGVVALRRAAHAENADERWRYAYVRTLVQFDRFPEARDEADRLMQRHGPHPDLIAYKAIAARSIDDAEFGFNQAIEELGSLGEDFRAKAWIKGFEGLAALEDAKPIEAAKKLAEATTEYPGEPALHLFHGDALDRLQRPEQAREAWTMADRLAAQPWVSARLRVVRSLVEEGQVISALTAAQETIRRSPQRIEAYLGWLAAFQAQLQRGLATREQRSLAEDILSSIETGLEGASLRAAAALERRVLPVRLLLELTSSQSPRLDAILGTPRAQQALEDDELATDIAAHLTSFGIDPPPEVTRHLNVAPERSTRLALVRAQRLARDGSLEQARSVLETPQGADEYPWALARVKLADRLAEGDQSARETADRWRALMNQYPERIALLDELLRSRTAVYDADLIEAAAERFADLTGSVNQPEPKVVVLARARATLIDDPGKQRLDKSIAALEDLIAQVPSHLSARTTLASLYLIEDAEAGIRPEPSRAAEHLLAASELVGGPTSAAYRLRGASLYQTTRDFDKARDALFRIMDEQEEADPALLVSAARLLLAQGEPDLALPLLNRASGGLPPEARADALIELARAHQRRADDAAAGEAYADAIKAGLSRPSQVLAAAAHFSRVGNEQARQEALAALDEMDLAPGLAEFTHARHAEQIGELERADRLYAEALALDPTLADAWSSLASIRLQRGDAEAAQAVIRDGLEQFPDNARLRVLQYQARARLDPEAELTDLNTLTGIFEQSESTRRIAQATAAIADLQEADALSDKDALLDLAARFEDVLGVQVFVARQLLSRDVGDPAAAADLLEAAIKSFPAEPEPARLATIAHANLGDYAEMQTAALRWRGRDPSAARLADLAIARSALQLDQLARARSIVERYLPDALQSPDEGWSVSVLQLWVRLAARTDQLQLVFDRLAPAISNSQRVLTDVWLGAVANSIEDWPEASRWLDTAEQYAASPELLMLMIDACRSWAGRAPTDQAAALDRAAEYAARLPDGTDDPRYLVARAEVERDLARLADEAGEQDEARERRSRAIDLLRRAGEAGEPGSRAQPLLLAAATAESMDDLGQAIELYQRVLAIGDIPPGVEAPARNNYAYLLHRRGPEDDPERALEQINAALAIAEHPSFHHTRGEILAAADRSEGAIEAFRAALRLDADHLASLASLALALARGDDELDRQEARRLLNRIEDAFDAGAVPPAVAEDIEAARRLLRE